MKTITNLILFNYFFSKFLYRKTKRLYYLFAIFEGILLRKAFLYGIEKISNEIMSKKTRIGRRFLSDTWNFSGWLDFEKDVFLKYIHKESKIQIISAGAGREVFSLFKICQNIQAFECNELLITKGNQLLSQTGIPFFIQYTKYNHCPLTKNEVDVVWIGWTGYTHIQGKKNRVNFLREVSSNLKSNGYLFLSYWILNNDSKYIEKIWINATKSNSCYADIIEKGDRLFPVFGHVFTLKEIEKEVEEAGYGVIENGTSYSGYLVAKKVCQSKPK